MPSVMIYRPLPADHSEITAVTIVVPDEARLIASMTMSVKNFCMLLPEKASSGIVIVLFPKNSDSREKQNMTNGMNDSMM